MTDTNHYAVCCHEETGDLHTLTPGCPKCESFAARPHNLSEADLRPIIAKFYPNGGGAGLPERTALDAKLMTAVERAYAIARTLGWIDPTMPISRPKEWQ